ncbi:MAG: signal recognition particle-docking protein FtsY, partial [Deltaproteobacteria bacterium]|nr:signal recognition particle-docking protein FtsY [Deltaproteobacteria bacterium]
GGPAGVAEKPERLRAAEGKTLKEGLAKTRSEGFVSKLFSLVKGKSIDRELLNRIEELLLTSDIGVATAEKLIADLKNSLDRNELKDETAVFNRLKTDIRAMLANSRSGFAASLFENRPAVILIVGVNGTGKTTTIGKLAHTLSRDGKKALLVAGDTFRAAAEEQLNIWAERCGCGFFGGSQGADPASVVFDGIKKGVSQGFDVIVVDTAGRLHTKVNLIDELKKVRRVTGKALEGAPHETLLVLDATTGQNAVKQAEVFAKELGVTGIVLAKLDGTARGGVVLSIHQMLNLPVLFAGTGEKPEDISPFDPDEFIAGLFEQ